MSDDKHTLTFTNTTRASVPTQSHPVEFYGLPTRCEPPEHLRSVDGWHWVQCMNGPQPDSYEPELVFWYAPEGRGVFAGPSGWDDSDIGEPESGYRYLAPVAPVDVVRGLVDALAPFANAGSIFALTDNDLGTARAALARAKEAGL